MQRFKEMLSGYLKKRHSVTKLVVHLVFTTKYRRKLLDGTMIQQLREAFESSCEKLECELIEMDGGILICKIKSGYYRNSKRVCKLSKYT